MREQRYRPYPKYKDSGVEWLGEIPAEWQVKRADAFLSHEKEQIDPSTISAEQAFHYSIPSIQASGDGQLESPSTIDSAKLAIVGTRLLVSKLNPRKGVVLIATEKDVPTLASTEFVPFDVIDCEMRWALYLFLAESTRQRLSATVRSATRSHQRAEVADITKVWHAVPTITEQRAIATFLDRETARIDALVARKERLITLLQERRTALITRAVTKGLDPAAPMKDSGVEWLGEIPAHWELSKMWQISSARSGGTPSRDERDYWEGDIPWVSPKDMKRRVIASSEESVTELAIDEAGLRLHEPPCVLIVVRGMILAHSFPVAITGVPVTINQDMKAVRFTSAMDPEFAVRLFEGIGKTILTTILEEAAHGTKAVRMDVWRTLRVPVPPVGEQHAIVTFVDHHASRLDALISRVRTAISRLHELRTALISAAVTGKIDVREAAQ